MDGWRKGRGLNGFANCPFFSLSVTCLGGAPGSYGTAVLVLLFSMF
jgi:hypothetical protein